MVAKTSFRIELDYREFHNSIPYLDIAPVPVWAFSSLENTAPFPPE